MAHCTVEMNSEGTELRGDSPSFEAVTAVVSRAFRGGSLSCAIAELRGDSPSFNSEGTATVNFHGKI